jgi:hypothetical protein
MLAASRQLLVMGLAQLLPTSFYSMPLKACYITLLDPSLAESLDALSAANGAIHQQLPKAVHAVDTVTL